MTEIDDQLLHSELAEVAREDLSTYTSLLMRTNEGAPAIPPLHLRELVMPALLDDSLGHTVIIAPPGSAKTNAAIAGVGFRVGRNPNLHTAFISSTATQAQQRSTAIRDPIAESDVYHTIFPEVKPDYMKGWGEHEWYVKRPNLADKDPTLQAVGVKGHILGSRLDYVILDDIADEDNQATPYKRDQIIRWLEKTLMTRLTPTGRIVMLCTRWNENDPAGWAIERGWKKIHIPALDGNEESYWPEFWPREKLKCSGEHNPPSCCKWWESGGSKGFNQQYMGIVQDESSALIKRDYWQRFDINSVDWDSMKQGGTFIDTAHTENTSSDYSVLTTAYTDGVNVYIRDVKRIKAEFPKLLDLIKQTREQFGQPIYIEQTLGGLPIIQTLKRQMPNVLAWKHRGKSKLARVEACLVTWESQNVYIPQGFEWAEEMITECAMFPVGEHDDMVDTMTMAIMVIGPQFRRRWSSR